MRAILLPLLLLAGVEADAGVVLPMPASPLYRSECGSCHTAYAPGFLPARSWKKLMAELDHHFGEEASLKDAERDLLSSQLQALALDTPNADPVIATRNGGAWAATTPLRLSTSPFFHYLHDEVPDSIWRRPKIASKANCGACHRQADTGRYPESEINIPQ